MNDVDETMVRLRTHGCSPYVMLTKDGFVVRLGVRGGFTSERGRTAVDALSNLLARLEGTRKGGPVTEAGTSK